MTSLGSYLGEGLHGLFMVVDWIIFPLYLVGSIGFLVMVVGSRAKIANPWLLILQYVHIGAFIGGASLLGYILFWNSSLAWLPLVLLWLQFIAMMAQEGIKARTFNNQPTGAQTIPTDALSGQSQSADLRSSVPLRTGMQGASPAAVDVSKLGFRVLSRMLAFSRKSNPRYNPIVTRRTADFFAHQENVRNPREAEPLYREALAAARQRWGDRHFRTAEMLEKLADLIQHDGGDEPERFYREAVAIREAVQGPDHIDTIISANKLVLFLASWAPEQSRGRERIPQQSSDVGES